jgi:phasin family protein
MMTNENTAKLVTDMATKANENMKQLGELQMNLWNQLVQKQVSTFNTVVEKTMSQSQAMSGAKNYQDVVRGQIDFSRQVTEDLVGSARESMDIVQDAGTKYRSFAESTVKEAAAKVSKAA